MPEVTETHKKKHKGANFIEYPVGKNENIKIVSQNGRPPNFYCVITDRDKLKIKKDGKVVEEKPIWHFIDEQEKWLISLAYAKKIKKIQQPPGYCFFDCGAWSYKKKDEPRWDSIECIEQYLKYANSGDIVTAPDHMVLKNHSDDEEKRRIDITLRNAKEFIRLCPRYFLPVAVTHGNDITRRINMTKELLDMGYRYIALGGLANRTSSRKYILEVLEKTCELRQEEYFGIHVLGVSGLSFFSMFREYNIDSYDGSSMFFNAFTGATYYWPDESKTIGFRKYSVKDLAPERLPLCNCSACKTMREQGDDTREMGSNERNMGRAVHNINMYLKARRILESR